MPNLASELAKGRGRRLCHARGYAAPASKWKQASCSDGTARGEVQARVDVFSAETCVVHTLVVSETGTRPGDGRRRVICSWIELSGDVQGPQEAGGVSVIWAKQATLRLKRYRKLSLVGVACGTRTPRGKGTKGVALIHCERRGTLSRTVPCSW